MTRRRATVAVAAVVVLAGAAVAAAGLRVPPPELRPGPTGFVNDDFPGINAHTSPAADADVRRPAVLAVADRIDSPAFSCSLARSTTAGRTWRRLPLPLPPGARTCYWPDVAFAGDGALLVLHTTYQPTIGRFSDAAGLWLQRYDGEAPVGAPVPVAGAGTHHARMAVDGSRVLVAWVQTGAETAATPLGFGAEANPVVLVRSDDGGRTFASPVAVSEPGRRAVQPTVLVEPGSETVVVGALDLASDVLDYEGRHGGQGGPPDPGPWRVVTWTSRDGGRTFAPGVTVAEVVPPSRVVVDLAPTPSFVSAGTGGPLFAAWDGGRGGARDVFVARSDDAGATWSVPVPVGPRANAQFLPALAASGGRLDVLFYDRSRDPEDELAETVLASSWDGGRSFVTSVVSDRPFDSRIGFASAQGLSTPSSQLALVSSPERAHAFWADSRRGTLDTGTQDLAAATVEIRPRGEPRLALVALGGGTALAGAGYCLASWSAARSPRWGWGRRSRTRTGRRSGREAPSPGP